ncbi:hypothetical protein SACE_4922 [Saccharopolyspora erythraea NRRL 2338]|uniref:Uncharacterized protein n=1 Tax=Saccharopolyspora erythraea (strain ATCC 11635 / DSM 40517 / JCM 4748 / NBRC 13426 / NCIMB 8594 / NRRL 2338) TaxID=405948 RepID=A4FJG3_SACEN|nr:hypothetical protein SACE_4922 [Saccharopolyspora erythraea NRRL 2338]
MAGGDQAGQLGHHRLDRLPHRGRFWIRPSGFPARQLNPDD